MTIFSLYVRGGRISGGQAHHFQSEFPDDELVTSFVNQYYADDAFVPKEVVLACSPNEPEALSELLSERKGEKVRVLVPQRGEKTDLVKLASKNAERAFSERKRSRDEVEQTLEKLKDKLHLSKLPHRMECFDISHFQGSALVASQVSSLDTEPDPSRYRHYKLKTVEGNDDFASMHEVLTRRFRRGLEEGDLPDLIVIDGGKGQLASAAAAMKDVGVEGVDLVSLAKSRDLESEAPDLQQDRSPERVFVLGRKDPIVLPQTSPEMFALTRLRDEAHRFAITFQRKLNRKRGLSSALDQVPGVGATRRTSLLRHFGSLKRLKEASIEEIAEVEGIGPAVAERLHAFLHAPKVKVVAELAEDEVDPIRLASLDDASAQGNGPEKAES